MKTVRNKELIKHDSQELGRAWPTRSLCRLSLSTVFCGILIFAAGAAPTQSPQDVNSPQVTSETPNVTEQQLWHSRIDMPANQANQKSKGELQHLIEQIRSVKRAPEIKVDKTVDSTIAIRQSEPNESPTKEKATAETPTAKPPSDSSQGQLSAKTLAMLKELSRHPEQAREPAQLGEVLFHSGNLHQAAIFYSQALKQKPVSNSWAAENHAWIQLQTANCLRNVDPTGARKAYKDLIEQYPDSLWTGLAKAEEKLLQWRLENKPAELVGRDVFVNVKR